MIQFLCKYINEQDFCKMSFLHHISSATFKTWAQILGADPGPGPWKTWTQKDLDSEKPGPWKTWTQKNLDPEKPGLWKTWTMKNAGNSWMQKKD